MGFTDVAWESRSSEQLARDLTGGPGPVSVGAAGAAWVRVANEMASVSEAYNNVVERIRASFSSQGADAAVTTGQSNAAAVMYQYEESCAAIAAPWDQPSPPDVCTGAALEADRHARSADRADSLGAAGGALVGAVVAPAPFAPFQSRDVKSSGERKTLEQVGSGGAGSGQNAPAGMGGYGPMAALARGCNHREHESSVPAGTLANGGEPGAGVSDTGGSWLPSTQHSDAAFTVSGVSWGPSTSVFDELATPDQPHVLTYADEPEPTLEQVSSQCVARPVIGADKGLTL